MSALDGPDPMVCAFPIINPNYFAGSASDCLRSDGEWWCTYHEAILLPRELAANRRNACREKHPLEDCCANPPYRYVNDSLPF